MCAGPRRNLKFSEAVTGVAIRIGKALHCSVKRFKISCPLDRKAATIAAIQSEPEVAVKPRYSYAAVQCGVWRCSLLCRVCALRKLPFLGTPEFRKTGPSAISCSAAIRSPCTPI